MHTAITPTQMDSPDVHVLLDITYPMHLSTGKVRRLFDYCRNPPAIIFA